MDKIEEILMNDELYRKHFVAKHPPKYEFSGEINPVFLGRNSSSDYGINWLKDYMGFPLVEDNFHLIEGGNIKRKKWRKEIEEKYGKEAREFVENNKLRKNVGLIGVCNATSLVESFFGEEYLQLRKYAEEIMDFGVDNREAYLDMNVSQKIELVRKMEDKAYEFLKLLCTN